MTGRTLAAGRYRLERQLGSGGMATVHLGYDEDLRRPVAIKVLADGLAADAAFRERFVREARLAGRLSHPNVVRVFDSGEEGVPYIVMEYVDGETLGELLAREGPLTVDDALGLARQAAAGLGHAHARGLVHRDVKPDNLLLGTDGTLKVADFGIARAAELSRLTARGAVLGTLAYLAPELATDDEVTPAADVYSLGAVVYQLLTGRPPRVIESIVDLGYDDPIVPVGELVPGLPPEAAGAVMRALARDPADRPSSAAQLGAELEGRESEEPTVVLPAPPRGLPPLRRSWTIGAAVFVVVLVIAGAIWAATGEEQAPAPPAPRVAPPAAGATAEEGARNLADWLRANSGAS